MIYCGFNNNCKNEYCIAMTQTISKENIIYMKYHAKPNQWNAGLACYLLFQEKKLKKTKKANRSSKTKMAHYEDHFVNKTIMKSVRDSCMKFNVIKPIYFCCVSCVIWCSVKIVHCNGAQVVPFSIPACLKQIKMKMQNKK